MRRFYLASASIAQGDTITIEGGLAHRLASVLRMRPGDEAALFDGGGTDAVIALREVNPRRVLADITARVPSPAEPRTRVHLFQSITKGERFE